MKRRKFEDVLLRTGQHMYRANGSGMIFYPTMPSKMHGSKEAGRPDFDVSHYSEWPEWMQNLDSEHGTVEVTADGYIIWWHGTVHDGIWMGDEKTIWMGGCWRDGIVLGGHFFNCCWVNGEKRGGDFHSGTWHQGIHRAGKFSGLWMGGVWMGGEWDGFRERSPAPPPLVGGNGYAF